MISLVTAISTLSFLFSFELQNQYWGSVSLSRSRSSKTYFHPQNNPCFFIFLLGIFLRQLCYKLLDVKLAKER